MLQKSGGAKAYRSRPCELVLLQSPYDPFDVPVHNLRLIRVRHFLRSQTVWTAAGKRKKALTQRGKTKIGSRMAPPAEIDRFGTNRNPQCSKQKARPRDRPPRGAADEWGVSTKGGGSIRKFNALFFDDRKSPCTYVRRLKKPMTCFWQPAKSWKHLFDVFTQRDSEKSMHFFLTIGKPVHTFLTIKKIKAYTFEKRQSQCQY